MRINEAYGFDHTPIIDTGFYQWLKKEWENSSDTNWHLKEKLEKFQKETNTRKTTLVWKKAIGIWEMFHYFKPACKSYEPINPHDLPGKEMVRKGLINAFGYAYIPWNGYFEISNGNLWARYNTILGGRVIAKTHLPNGMIKIPLT